MRPHKEKKIPLIYWSSILLQAGRVLLLVAIAMMIPWLMFMLGVALGD